jgi:antitoxin component YwqK of YwqJK toxin-antitoxin module
LNRLVFNEKIVNTNLFYCTSKPVIWVLIIQLLYTCTYKNPEDPAISNEEIRNVYDAYGNLKSKIKIRDGQLNGEAITYYPAGQISTTVNYINNKKEGIEKKYYKQGQLYRTRTFEDGKANGIEKRFYKTGEIKTIQEFKYNNPAKGLIEYSISGKKISDYPRIIFEIVNERDYAEQVLLLFHMSDYSETVNYYAGKLIKNNYFDNEAEPELCNKGVGEIWLQQGFSGTIFISAKLVRESRGLFITQARVRLRNGRISEVIY